MVVGRAGPESREGGQDEVHDAVDVADVEGEDLHDGLREEEAEGALEGGAEVLAELAVGGVELGVEVFVAGLLDQLDLFAAEDLGGVGLVEEEEAHNLDDDSGNAGGVEDPAPVAVLGDEATCDGSDGRAEQRHEGIQGHGTTTLLRHP